MVMTQKLIKHPKTGEVKCVSAWAKELGIHRSAMTARLKRHSLEVALAPGPLPPKISTRLFTCPQTQKSLTAHQWAKKLGIFTKEFWRRIDRYGENDPQTYDYPAVVVELQGSAIHIIAKRRNARFLVHPITKEEFLPFELAAKYNIPINELYQLMKTYSKKYGPNSIQFFKMLEEMRHAA